jgi:hypothetical protein
MTCSWVVVAVAAAAAAIMMMMAAVAVASRRDAEEVVPQKSDRPHAVWCLRFSWKASIKRKNVRKLGPVCFQEFSVKTSV